MRRLAVIAVVVLAGCSISQSPKEIMSEGTPTVHRLKSEAQTAAYCMLRNVENWERPAIAAPVIPQVRPLPPGYELIVTAHSLEPSTIFVAHVMPDPPGSVAKIWQTGRAIVHGRDVMKAAMLSGC